MTEDVGLAGEPDPVGLSLVLRTSYDQSWRFEAALMGKRFACDNGLLSGEFFARVSFKHTSGSEAEDWREVVRQGMRLVHRAPADLSRFCSALRRLRQAQTSDKRLREAWALFPQFGDGLVGKITRRYVEHEEPTLYRALAGGDERALARPEADGVVVVPQRRVRDGARRVRERAPQLSPWLG